MYQRMRTLINHSGPYLAHQDLNAAIPTLAPSKNKRLDKVLIRHSREVVSHAKVILIFSKIISTRQTLFSGQSKKSLFHQKQSFCSLISFLSRQDHHSFEWNTGPVIPHVHPHSSRLSCDECGDTHYAKTGSKQIEWVHVKKCANRTHALFFVVSSDCCCCCCLELQQTLRKYYR